MEIRDLLKRRKELQTEIDPVLNRIDELTKSIAPIQAKISEIEQEITSHAIENALTMTAEGVAVIYSTSRGSYNYPAIAKELNPSPEIVQKHSKTVTDWNKVCEEAGMSKELKNRFYIPGSPRVVIEVLR